MQLSRALELLVLGLSAISVAEATFVNVNVAGRDGKGIQQRQNDDDANTDAATTTTPDEPTTTSTPAEPTTTSTSSSEPETTKTSETTQAPPPTTSSSTIPPATTSSSPRTTPTSSTKDPSPTEAPEPSTTAENNEEEEEKTTLMVTRTITTTGADGSAMTLTSETLTTVTPGLADNGNSGQSSGMSTQTRNTVIGVVVGVGGAIILGGLALVAWRIWGRKKHQEENDGLMDYGSAIDSKPESGGSMTGRTPFQSTLESYHAPTQVNTAANF